MVDKACERAIERSVRPAKVAGDPFTSVSLGSLIAARSVSSVQRSARTRPMYRRYCRKCSWPTRFFDEGDRERLHSTGLVCRL